MVDPGVYLAVHYRPEIDALLEKIADELERLGATQRDADVIAKHVADISAINFKAGAEWEMGRATSPG